MKRGSQTKLGRKTKRRVKHRKTRKGRRQRGGAFNIPSGYEHMMALSYKPKADPGKHGSPDEVPTVGGMDAFKRDMERAEV